MVTYNSYTVKNRSRPARPRLSFHPSPSGRSRKMDLSLFCGRPASPLQLLETPFPPVYRACFLSRPDLIFSAPVKKRVPDNIPVSDWTEEL